MASSVLYRCRCRLVYVCFLFELKSCSLECIQIVSHLMHGIIIVRCRAIFISDEMTDVFSSPGLWYQCS